MDFSDKFFGAEPDIRVKSWPLMATPFPILGILIAYLLSVKILAPSYMANRRPYNLKKILAVYNLGQVLACIYLIRGILLTDSSILKFWICKSVTFTYDETSLNMLHYCYFTLWLKLLELIETVFFVLRKKHNQVSFLHVYHHCVTVSLVWILTKYIGGGTVLFTVFLNACVHVIMYSYYLIALLGENIQNKLLIVKKSITIIQMAQFTLLLLQAAVNSFKTECAISYQIKIIYVFVVVSIFYLFYDFYKKSYNTKKTKSKNSIK